MYKISKYIDKIRNPEIREIYTRLRIDMNLLSTSKIHGNQNRTLCLLCENENETVGHFILRCSKYQTVRENSFEMIKRNDLNFSHLSDDEKLRYILDVRCPEVNLGKCCNFIHDIYKLREKDNVLGTS